MMKGISTLSNLTSHPNFHRLKGRERLMHQSDKLVLVTFAFYNVAFLLSQNNSKHNRGFQSEFNFPL